MHRINYGQLWDDADYKADCSCGWSFRGSRNNMMAAMVNHKIESDKPPPQEIRLTSA